MRRHPTLRVYCYVNCPVTLLLDRGKNHNYQVNQVREACDRRDSEHRPPLNRQPGAPARESKFGPLERFGRRADAMRRRKRLRGQKNNPTVDVGSQRLVGGALLRSYRPSFIAVSSA
jgi:hypothetical protein